MIKSFEEAKPLLNSVPKTYLIDHDEEVEGYPSIRKLSPEANLPSRERSLDETAVIIYTSGTTGNPKGVMTTVGNLLFQATQFEVLIDPREGDRFLSILPLNHLLELTHGFLGILHAGGTIYYNQSLFPKDIIALMKEKRITGMIGVPLFFRTLKSGIEREISKGGSAKKTWWRLATKLGELINVQKFRRFLFAPLHKNLGNRLKLFISGGAPLEVSTGQFFQLIGIPILQGYGLTETSPVISCNTYSRNKLGSVGPAIPGVEIKIETSDSDSEEGEILTRGPHVMKGYFKQPELTATVIDKDGWFHTGDLGKIDKDGFLYITGRIKNLIVLGGGKKVHPEEVEGVFATSSNVKEICVLGVVAQSGSKEGTEEVCAVIVPTDSFKNGFSDPMEMKKSITDEMQELSKQLASYKRPSSIIIMDSELPKTATRKVKRNEVVKLINDSAVLQQASGT
jgi:long-chain acyl-CoA synthetase